MPKGQYKYLERDGTKDSMVKKEITNFLHGLQKEGYGIHLICHAKEAGEENNKYWTPSLTATAAKVGMGFVDQIIFIDTSNPQQREACFRYDGNGMPFVAGSRFQHIVNRVPLGFDAIMSAMSDAIDKLGDENLVDTIQMNEYYRENDIPEFEENMAGINEIISAIMKDPTAKNKNAISSIIEKHLGVGKKIGEANRLQNQFCHLILLDLQDYYQSCKPKED